MTLDDLDTKMKYDGMLLKAQLESGNEKAAAAQESKWSNLEYVTDKISIYILH